MGTVDDWVDWIIYILMAGFICWWLWILGNIIDLMITG